MKTQTKLLFIAFFGYLFLGVALYELSGNNRFTLHMTFNLVLSLVAFLLSQYIFYQKKKPVSLLVVIALFFISSFYRIIFI